jgi:hypothetical protein
MGARADDGPFNFEHAGGGGSLGAVEASLNHDGPSLPHPAAAQILRPARVRTVETFTMPPVTGPFF